MWRQIFLAAIFPLSSVALSIDGVEFSIDYFKYRNINLICLLSCDKDVSWTSRFSKSAFNNSMLISAVAIDHVTSDLSSVQQCLEYKLHSVGVILNGNCKRAEDIMYFASENLFYSAQHKWLIIENDIENVIFGYYNSSEIDMAVKEDKENCTMMRILNNLSLSVDTDVIYAYRGLVYSLRKGSVLPFTVAMPPAFWPPFQLTSMGRNSLTPEPADYSEFYTLYDVFNFGKIQGGNLIVNKIGSYDVLNGLKLQLDLNEYKFYRRWNFQNWTMRMILVASPAPKKIDINQIANLESVPGIATITQTAGAILCIVAEIHNIRYIPTFTDRWIATFKRNSTKSATNSLYFRESDISPVVRLLAILNGNIDILLPPLTSIETRYYYRIPTKGTGKFENQFLMPLNPKAWWGVIGILVLCALALVLSACLEQRPSSAQYAVFAVIASICQQFYEDIDDGMITKISTARKITILVTGLSCVLIFNYYTSSVVSWLLSGPPPSINSLKELLDSPLELIFEDVGYTRSWLQTPDYYYNKKNARIEDELRQKKVFGKKKGAPLLEPLVEGIGMVQRGGYAYHTVVNSANMLISRTFDQSELCELGSLQSMEKTVLHPCMQKNSPYKEFMTWSLMRLLERGFVSCIQARTAAPEVKCEGSSPRALALGGAAPAFILLFGGYLLATMIMFCERLVHKIKINLHLRK